MAIAIWTRREWFQGTGIQTADSERKDCHSYSEHKRPGQLPIRSWRRSSGLPSRPVGVLSCLHDTIAVGGTGIKYPTLYVLREL